MQRMILAAVLCVCSGIAVAELSEKVQKNLVSTEIAYQAAIRKANSTRYQAVQKATAERVKALKQAMTEATKTADLDGANKLKDLIAQAEAIAGRSRPKDLTKFGSNQYAVIDEKITWYQAKQRCEEMGGHLATLTSPEEQAFVLALCREAKISAWQGASNDNGLQWMWLSGEPAVIDSATWKLDNAQRDHFACALVYWAESDSFNDHNFGAFLGYVCEWEK